MKNLKQHSDSTDNAFPNKSAPADREDASGYVSTTVGNFRIAATIATLPTQSPAPREVSAKLETEHYAFNLSNVGFATPERSELELVLLRKSDCCTLTIHANNNSLADTGRLPEKTFRVSTPCCCADIDLVPLPQIESGPTHSSDPDREDIKKKRKRVKRGVKKRLGSSLFAATPLKDLLVRLDECCESDRRDIIDIKRKLSDLSR